jgi:hypothetical protein
MKKKVIEQTGKCGTSVKKRKTDKVSTCSELENVLYAWYHQARASGIPVDGSILWEKSLKIAATMGIENFSASNSLISCFKQCHGLVFKKLVGRVLWWTPMLRTSGLRGVRRCWRGTRLGTSIMQIKWASLSIACQTECWH